MPENEFEKQVQQKIDELKFDPSAEVWENVAVAIGKRKKDKWGLAIIFLTLLLIGTAIYILFNHTSNQKNDRFISDKNNPEKINKVQEKSNDRDIPKIVDTANIAKSVEKNPVVNGTVERIDNAVTKEINNQTKSSVVHSAENKNPFVKKNRFSNNNSVNDTDDVYNNAGKQQYKTSQKLNASVSNSNAVDLVNEKGASADTDKSIHEDNSPVVNDVTVKVQVTDSLSKVSIDSIKHTSNTVAVVLSEDNKKDTTAKKTMQPKKKSGWELGFNFSFGATATQNGYLGISSGNNNELYSYAAISQSPGSNSGQVSSVYASSTIKPGTGIMVGLFVQKNMSPKTKILFGLNYRIYSSVMINNISTVSYDSANNGTGNLGFGSTSSSSERYKNNFHFLELPVAMQFKLSKQNKLPVYLNTGISIAQLLGSNVRQFYTSSAQYSNNNNPLNKTQFSLSAGLLFSLSQQAKNPFLIGPDLSFSLNKMANSGLYKNSHYSYLGILIQKTIGKK